MISLKQKSKGTSYKCTKHQVSKNKFNQISENLYNENYKTLIKKSSRTRKIGKVFLAIG